jgi:hypothetical protein
MVVILQNPLPKNKAHELDLVSDMDLVKAKLLQLYQMEYN